MFTRQIEISYHLKIMETTTDIFKTIEKTYLTRCTDTSAARTTWQNVMDKYPPEKLHEFSKRPSLDLARQSGDLGLALLWGAQATLIRPLVKRMIDHETNKTTLGFLEAILPGSVGALAIVEDKNHPFTVSTQNDHLMLNGKKKYITGGTQSDFILLTEKNISTKKLSGIIFIETKIIPESALKPLSMGSLDTSRHASLTLSKLIIPSENRLSLEPRTLRKMLKTWGMIEQSLIIEAVTGLSLYLADRIETKAGKRISAIDSVNVKLQQLSAEIDQQVEAAIQGEFIEPILPETGHITSLINDLNQSSNKFEKQRDELAYRFRDIQFFLGKM